MIAIIWINLKWVLNALILENDRNIFNRNVVVILYYSTCDFNTNLPFINFLFTIPIKYSLLNDCYQYEMNCWYTLSHKFSTPSIFSSLSWDFIIFSRCLFAFFLLFLRVERGWWWRVTLPVQLSSSSRDLKY